MELMESLLKRITENGEDVIFFVPFVITLVLVLVVGHKILGVFFRIIGTVLSVIFNIGEILWQVGKITGLLVAIQSLTVALALGTGFSKLASRMAGTKRKGSRNRSSLEYDS